jgi:cytochrome c biogenesis protein CcmG/thiol:disulfide interchange protein DsbE
VGRWVDARLAMLTPPEGWRPDAAAGLARLSRRRDAGRTWNGRWAWAPVIVATAVCCIIALAFPITRVSAQRCVNACVAETSLAGRFLWNSLSGSSTRPGGVATIGERPVAPDFTLRDASGRSVRLSDFRGQVVLLNFWATWCSPCRIEIPWFAEFQRAYRSAGFAVLGVSLDQDGWKAVKPYIEAKKVNYRVMLGDDEITRIYGGLESLPTTLLIDKAGRIAMTHVGLVEKKTYEEDIRVLIAEN